MANLKDPQFIESPRQYFRCWGITFLAYAKNGKAVEYRSWSQADKKVLELQSLGYNVKRCYEAPFLIHLQDYCLKD